MSTPCYSHGSASPSSATRTICGAPPQGGCRGVRALQHAMVFQYEDRREFRTFEIDGDPWFVLGDVCRALDIKNPSDAASRLDDDEKGVAQTETPGGPQKARIINESCLYSLILRSDKP